MRSIYLAVESISAIVILVLLYANVFELKHHTKKRDIFTRLLIINEAVVLIDVFTWMNFDWNKMIPLFWLLITLTYIVPFYLIGIFTKYLHQHISEKAQISEKPFQIIFYLNIIVSIVTFLLCLTGKLFIINDGKYYSGPLEKYYYLFYIFSLVFFSIVIIWNGKKLGFHDLFAALSFCFFPLFSILISFTKLGINLAIPFMAIDTLVIYVMLQSERENNLFFQSNNDGLTGVYNRRAYEDDMNLYSEVATDEDFIYASVDVNGLKQINDNLSHVAGDELICGAANCIQQVFGKIGKVYRTGGDEFVIIFFADEDELEYFKDKLAKEIAKWSGKLVESLAISVGYVSKREFPEETVTELSKIAEKRMYEAKRKYYADMGIDRRGQAAAHTALCNLYTKILKINLTKDSYSIINMDSSEQTPDKGFADTISGWFSGFGKSGQVHTDDLEDYLLKTDLNYLKNYFKEGKTSISIFYRRKYGEIYKQSAMEMIPADDYSLDNQTLFLYVRNIDRNQ